MKWNPFFGAAAFAFVLGFILLLRSYFLHDQFQTTVFQSQLSTEGYDKKLVDLVRHMEDILATRASFGYGGEKDPLTGKTRQVVLPEASKRKVATKENSNPSLNIKDEVDPVRLTAIVTDDYGINTAVVMDGERSLSVDAGDTVNGRRVIKITKESVIMEKDGVQYYYDVSGKKEVIRH